MNTASCSGAPRLLLTLALALLCASCTVRQQTVAPRPIVTAEASFDGNEQNSGIISFDEHGFIVTRHWLERYDGMLATWGTRFVPNVHPGDRDGVETLTPSTYRVTAAVMVRNTRMNGWRKAEAGP